MRRFDFRLEAALRWRRSQLDAEQIKLRSLLAELAAIQSSIAELESAEAPERTSVHSSEATPGERAGLDEWLRWAHAERSRLLATSADCERRIADQREGVVAARRQAELLEKLRTRKLREWTGELNREIEQIAAEAYAARRSQALL
ncbi:MAG TPA: hypothetical protein VFL57_09940 [Bryobacteraceae bacterium]|nr:hypothetical protein [Bryobacteraceae bacterium]